ncbi:MAG: hypothetical protein WCE21_05015 [Candidatus Babeliales bacterium]
MKQSVILLIAACMSVSIVHAQETVLQQFDRVLNQKKEDIAQASKKQENTVQIVRTNGSLFAESERDTQLKRIDDIQSTFSQAQQAAADALQKIETTVLTQKQALVNQYGDDTTSINKGLQSVVAEQIIALNDAYAHFQQNVQAATQELINLSQKLKQIKAAQEAQKQYASGAQAQQAREQLLQQITPFITQLSQLDTQARTFFNEYQKSNTFETKQAFTFFGQYGALVQQATQAYSAAHVSISWSNNAQYVSVIFKHMVTFFISDVHYTVRALGKDLVTAITRFDAYETILKKVNVLLHRVYGAQGESGYIPQLEAIIQASFVPAEQQTVRTYCMQQYARIIIPLLQGLLTGLAQGHGTITQEQFKMVQLCHQEIIRASDFMGKQQGSTVGDRASNAIGTIAQQLGHSLLEAIALDDFGKEAHEAALQAWQTAESYYTMAHNDIDAQTVHTAQTNLNAALYYWALAAQEGDVKKAITLYQQVYYFCAQIDDAIGAYKAYKQSQDLAIQETHKQVQEQVHTLLHAESSSLKQWIAQVSAELSQVRFDRKHLDQLLSACDQVITLCKTIVALHLQSNVIASKEQEAIAVLEHIKVLISFISAGIDAFNQQSTIGVLHALLNNTLGIAALLDTTTLDEALQLLVPLGSPLFGQKEQMSWVRLLMRTVMALISTQLAAHPQDKQAVQLILYALMYGAAYLTDAEQTWLRNAMATAEIKRDVLAQEAQTIIDQALQNSTPWRMEYNNAQLRMIEGLLRYQQLLFVASDATVQERYNKAVDAYVERLAQQKEGGAVWNRWWWVAVTALFDPTQQLKVQKVLDAIAQENDALIRSIDTISAAVDAQKKEQELLDWRRAALGVSHTAVRTQLNGAVQKLSVTVSDHAQKLTFAAAGSAHSAQEIPLGDYAAMMGHLYECVAQAQEKNDRASAQLAAQQAAEWYARANNEQKVQEWWAFMNRMMSTFIIENYQKLVEAHDATTLQGHTITGVVIPHYYTLTSWKQSIPVVLSKPFALEGAAPAQQTLFDLTRLLFLYSVLQEKGIDIATVMNGATVSAEKVTDEKKKEIVKTSIDVVDEAIAYVKDRVEKQITTVHVEKQDNPAFPFALVITQQPIEAVPPFSFMPQPLYRNFPTALSYFQWITKLADPRVTSVLYGTKIVPSLHDQTSFDMGKRLTMQAYLTQGALLLEQMNYIASKEQTYGPPLFRLKGTIKKIIDLRATVAKVRAVKKDDMTARIADYDDAYKMLQQYGQEGVISYVQFAAQYATPEQQANDFIPLLSDLYEYMGGVAELFLIGDPQQERYFAAAQTARSGVLADCIDCYTTAYSLDPKRAARLQKKIVDLCINAGNTVARKQKKYVSAVPFYKEALGVLQAMDNPDLKLIDEAALNAMKAYLFAGLKNMQFVQQAIAQPITITSGTQKETVDLETLVQQVGFCPNPNVPVPKCTAYQKIHDSFVDALVQLQDAQSWAQVVQKLYGGVKGADAQVATRQKQAQDSLKKYFADKKVNFDTVDAIKALVTRKDGISVITHAFSTIANQTHKTVEAEKRASGFALLYEFMRQLFGAFGKLYMHYYMKGVESDDQLNQLISSLAVERSHAQGALQDWFGIS